MKRIFIGKFIALGISLVFISCNSGDKKEESTDTKTDTTQTSTDTPKTDAGPDAVSAAPALYKVLRDSAGIRILEVNYQVGDSSVMHSHPDYAVYALQSAKAVFTRKDGTMMENELKAGQTMISGADWHSVKNTGKGPVKVILFESTRMGQLGSPDATLDATKVSPGLYKLKNDSLGIRIIEVNYKAGQSSGLHSHPDAALYVTEGSTGEFTGKDGTKRTMVMEKGLAIVVPADAHTVKNTGKTAMKGILVEFYKAK